MWPIYLLNHISWSFWKRGAVGYLIEEEWNNNLHVSLIQKLDDINIY